MRQMTGSTKGHTQPLRKEGEQVTGLVAFHISPPVGNRRLCASGPRMNTDKVPILGHVVLVEIVVCSGICRTQMIEKNGSSGRTRTYNPSVNSRNGKNPKCLIVRCLWASRFGNLPLS